MIRNVWIPGRAVPQGSATIQRFNTAHRGMVVSSNKARLVPWRGHVATVLSDAWGDRAPLGEPVHVELEFCFARPKSHYGSGRNAHVLKSSASEYPVSRGQGDVDKLARAVLDGMTDAGVLADDSCVVQLLAVKLWERKEGVRVTVRPLYPPTAGEQEAPVTAAPSKLRRRTVTA